jgi:uncharacterized protein YndB with AHSA1/START domain
MKTVWSIDIEAPPERVWEELTRTGKVLRFYFDSVLEGDLRPGGKLRYVTPDRKRTFIVGDVVELTAPTRFVHTFKFTDLAEPAQKVSFDLEPVEKGTRLTVRHEGLGGAPKHGRRVDAGWTKILGDLKRWTESGRVSLGTRLRNSLMKLMLPFMPKESADAP